MTGRQPAQAVRLLPLLVGLLVLLVGCTGGTTATPTVTHRSTPAQAIAGPFNPAPPSDWSGDTIAMGDLPSGAIETLKLVEVGGPYPFPQDDGVFGNRERILPARGSGTYREYTVVTPGSPDRGARRLVIADRRDVYYTDDHYASFRFVTP